MQLTINIPNEQLFERIVWLLNSFKNDGLEIIENNPKKIYHNQKELDFSSFPIKSFKELDGLEYQKKIRDEW
ncbi:MAG: hypothetical protein Q9M36_08245 [Sulfurovum sp.]|nr:hypothetical protein [Sulfurovum sp.]